jgi:ABC-type nitrate/sulfonate/bicarbonate transport system permease component
MTGRPGIVIVCILLFAICGKLTDMVIERTGGYFLRWKKAGEQA